MGHPAAGSVPVWEPPYPAQHTLPSGNIRAGRADPVMANENTMDLYVDRKDQVALAVLQQWHCCNAAEYAVALLSCSWVCVVALL